MKKSIHRNGTWGLWNKEDLIWLTMGDLRLEVEVVADHQASHLVGYKFDYSLCLLNPITFGIWYRRLLQAFQIRAAQTVHLQLKWTGYPSFHKILSNVEFSSVQVKLKTAHLPCNFHQRRSAEDLVFLQIPITLTYASLGIERVWKLHWPRFSYIALLALWITVRCIHIPGFQVLAKAQ